MIANRLLRGDRRPVVANIAQAAAAHDWQAKVETGDPAFTLAEEQDVINDYLARRQTIGFKTNTLIARTLMHLATIGETAGVRVLGRENLAGVHGGAIVTSNHFSPVENMIVRKAVRGHRLMIVSQATNLRMPGFLGFMMNYADTIPLSTTLSYMGHQFPALLQEAFAQQRFVLIYPEQEMWFNYDRPRPVQRGAYYYAARFHVPVVSCFVTMQATAKVVSDDFNAVRFTMHVLPLIVPDPGLSVKENSEQMRQQDFKQKAALFEQTYGRPVDGPVDPADIAGWRHDSLPLASQK